MGKRQRDWAKRAHRKLIQSLGGRCVDCNTTSDLAIDHRNGRNWEPREREWSHRISIYRREATQGLLTVRCGPCNKKKGDMPEDPPF